MKKFILLSVVFTTTLLYGQKNNLLPSNESFQIYGKTILIDQRVIDHFGIQEVKNLKDHHPDGLLYWNFYVQNGYRTYALKIRATPENFIEDVRFKNGGEEKSKTSEIKARTGENLNLLELDLQVGDSYQYFKTKVAGTGILILSRERILDEFNMYKSSLQ